jgi:hypothetical protein
VELKNKNAGKHTVEIRGIATISLNYESGSVDCRAVPSQEDVSADIALRDSGR